MSAEPSATDAILSEVKVEGSGAPESNATQSPPSPAPAAGSKGLNKRELDVLDNIVKRMSDARDPEE
jgi:hypothetical protein